MTKMLGFFELSIMVCNLVSQIYQQFDQAPLITCDI